MLRGLLGQYRGVARAESLSATRRYLDPPPGSRLERPLAPWASASARAMRAAELTS